MGWRDFRINLQINQNMEENINYFQTESFYIENLEPQEQTGRHSSWKSLKKRRETLVSHQTPI